MKAEPPKAATAAAQTIVKKAEEDKAKAEDLAAKRKEKNLDSCCTHPGASGHIWSRSVPSARLLALLFGHVLVRPLL